ncbi:UNVERIFIED_CONTAM: hypothetical protein PYX00_005460 [Menopon gallinae]|uniref:Uncharacterized protein n=1 Tax=Menopon gallinae TaxID=328185 RepID=A0AAW2HR97_9NEOP
MNTIIMENLMNALAQMQENPMLNGNAHCGISTYVSCIKVNGRPILPPLITDETRRELVHFREKAIEVENRLAEEKKRRATFVKPNTVSTPSHSLVDMSPLRQSTPTRPDTLRLLPDFIGKTALMSSSSDSRINKSLSVQDNMINSDISSGQRSTNRGRRKSFRSSLEHRLANDDSVQSRKNLYGQSPIIEENFIGDGEDHVKGRWSPLSVDSVSLKDEKSEIVFDEQNYSMTLTESPNLMRQNSYTLLKPSPALLQYIESQKENEDQRRSQSGRKTWDLTKARRNWGTSNSTDSLDVMNKESGESLMNKDGSVEGFQGSKNENSFTDDGSTSPSSYSYKANTPKFQKMKSKVRSKTQKNVPSPKSMNKVSNHEEQKQGSETVFVPLKVKEELNVLSDLFLKLKVEHERQKKELEERQKSEMKELEMMLKKRESELIEASRQNVPVVENIRPQSAKDCYSPCFTDHDSRRTRSMDFNQGPPGRDTDLDVSFQDSLQSRDMYVSKEDAADTDTVSNCSSHLSSMSSDSKLESMPLLDVKKFRTWDIKLEDMQKYNDAAAVITAAAKGFLTRRLLRTAHVQGLITTLRDAISCATQLHDASDLGESDVELMKRLGRQIEAAWEAVYSVFFETDTAAKMQLISADRERLRSISAKAGSAEPKKRISKATLKSLRRKSGSEVLMTRSQITNGSGSASSVRSRMVSSYPSPGNRYRLK